MAVANNVCWIIQKVSDIRLGIAWHRPTQTVADLSSLSNIPSRQILHHKWTWHLMTNGDHYTVSAGYIIGASQVKVPGPNVEWRAERQRWAGLGKLDIVFRYNNWGAAEHGGLSLRTDTARPLPSRHRHRLSRKIVYLNKPQQPPSQPQIPSLCKVWPLPFPYETLY